MKDFDYKKYLKNNPLLEWKPIPPVNDPPPPPDEEPSIKEGYELGAKYSKDFDYDGMVRMGLSMDENSDVEDLQALYNSFEDVNYHSENQNLGLAIDALKDGDKEEAEIFIGDFHDDLQDLARSFGMEDVMKKVDYNLGIGDERLGEKKDHDGDGDIDSDDYLIARDKAIKKAKGEANEEVTPEEEDKLKDIEGELNKASKMHKSQADRIGKIVKEMSDEEFEKAKEAERLENHPEKDKIKAIQAMMDKERKMKKSDLKEFIKSVLNEDDINESVSDKALNKIFKFFSRDLYGELKLDMGQAKKLTYEIEKLINKGL